MILPTWVCQYELKGINITDQDFLFKKKKNITSIGSMIQPKTINWIMFVTFT